MKFENTEVFNFDGALRGMRMALGITAEKIDRSILKEEWVYVRRLKGWIKVTVKEAE